MNRKILYTLLLCVLCVCCRGRNSSLREIDLTRDLTQLDVASDTEVIVFGTPEARPFLVSGWSSPEKRGGRSFQWAVEQNPIVLFNAPRRVPLYLSVHATSFYPNSAEVLVNKKPIGTMQVDRDSDVTTLTVPADALTDAANAVEFKFAELREADNKKDTRKLAAAFYSAVISPSKYVADVQASTAKAAAWKVDTLLLNGKKRTAVMADAGLSWVLHKNLRNAVALRFGAFYKPSPLAEEDDFADFRVLLRRDGHPEQVLFSQRMNTTGYKNAEIQLDRMLDHATDGIGEIEFRLQRNSAFNATQAAWVEPELVERSPAAPSVDTARIETLRSANRNANVVFMLLDAGGAKHFSSYGYFRNTTPVIDALARDSVLFRHAYTNAVYTLASTATLMSGLDPLHHRIITRKSALPEESLTLAERFDGAGYSTGTFVANGNASGIFGLTQGFQHIAEVFRDPNYTGWAMDITNHFTSWLDQHPRQPFFAYLHFREPHGPYNPPPQWKFKYTDPNYHGIAAQEDVRKAINFGEIPYTQADKDYITALYDANLNYADYEVGRVLKKLKDSGIYDNTIVIVTADHGEAFWEHNFQGHNSQLYEESIHIPLILKLTGKSNMKGVQLDQRVRTEDYYPTFLDLLNMPQWNSKVDGRSWLPYLASTPDDGRPIITQTIMEQQYAYRDGDYKYLVRLSNRDEELYNLKNDPLEKHNLIAELPVHARYFRSQMLRWLATSRKLGAFQKGEHAKMDESAKENLKALGYIGEE